MRCFAEAFATVVLLFASPICFGADITKEMAERDLALEVELQSAKTIGPGEPIGLRVSLKNQSKETTYPVVKPGDGSEIGWREPYVFFTAKRQSDENKWENVPKASYGRCGLFDSNWQKDIVTLKPNESIELKDWLSAPSHMLEIQKAGRVRIYVHYRFTRGTLQKGKPAKVESLPKSMKDIPTFELVSDPVELYVLRPLDVRVKVKSPLKAKKKTKLSEILDIQLSNCSMEPITASSPSISADARLRLEIKGKMPGWRPTLTAQKSTYGIKKDLEPRESVSLLGPSEFANGMDGTWEYPVADIVKVRAIYHRSTWKPSAMIASEWVDVKVAE